MGPRDRAEADKIEEVFYFHLSDVMYGELSFVGRELPIDGGYGHVDVLNVNLDNRFARFIAVDRHSSVYENVVSRVGELDGDWSYITGPSEERQRSVDTRGLEEGDYLVDSHGRESDELQDFFQAVLGYEVFDRLESVDEKSLDL